MTSVIFPVPSTVSTYASMFILGMSRNGRIDWKNKNGLSLKELEEKETLE